MRADDEAIQEAGRDYAASLAAVEDALRTYGTGDPSECAPFFVAALMRAGWSLERVGEPKF